MRPTTKFTCTTNTSQMPIKCKASGLSFSSFDCRRGARSARHTKHNSFDSVDRHFISYQSIVNGNFVLYIINIILKRSLSFDEVNTFFVWLFLSQWLFHRNKCHVSNDSVNRRRNCPINEFILFCDLLKISRSQFHWQQLFYTFNVTSSQNKQTKYWEIWAFYTFLVQNCHNNFYPGIFNSVLWATHTKSLH